MRGYPQPDWLGQPDIRGKTILVHWEQGDGDTFQFARYIPILEERTGARVIFATQRRLRHLLRSVSPSAQYASVDDANLKFDFHAPLMSLPRALGTTLATVPTRCPTSPSSAPWSSCGAAASDRTASRSASAGRAARPRSTSAAPSRSPCSAPCRRSPACGS